SHTISLADSVRPAPAPDSPTLHDALPICNGSAPLQITQTPAAGTLVGLGVTTVTLNVIDAANNESTCTATFTVTDNIPPVITTSSSNQTAVAESPGQPVVPHFTTNYMDAT